MLPKKMHTFSRKHRLVFDSIRRDFVKYFNVQWIAQASLNPRHHREEAVHTSFEYEAPEEGAMLATFEKRGNNPRTTKMWNPSWWSVGVVQNDELVVVSSNSVEMIST
jgi:hypothetical protein